MKTGLLFKDKPFRLRELNSFDKALIDDLELELIIKEASDRSKVVRNVFENVLLSPIMDKELILYRQEILKDVLNNKAQTFKFYDLVSVAIYNIKDKFRFGIIDTSPSSVVRTSVDMMKYAFEQIEYAREYLINFSNVKSDGLKSFIEDMNNVFDPKTIAKARTVLNGMDFENGYMMSAELDSIMTENNYIFHRSTFIDKDSKKRWKKAEVIEFPTMTESLVNDTNKKLDLAFKSAAPIMGRVMNDIMDYLDCLRNELAFYVGCINLNNSFTKYGMELSFPNISDNNDFIYENLYDVALSLKNKQMAVGNNHNILNKKIMVITGANQGGKTTFLRSFGQAKLMLQSGMFVGAKSLTLGLTNGIYTHFDREEDTNMESGKLDDELKRLSLIIDDIKPGATILLNESFQSTNEREGSTIGFEIIRALLDSDINIILVTHMYELAIDVKNSYDKDAIFMRAERNDDGSRTFKISENETLRTSYAMDLYNKIFME